MPTGILNTFGQVRLNAQGNGTVTLGPNIPGVVWNIATKATVTTSVVNSTTLLVYAGSALAGNFAGGSNSAELDSDDVSITLYTGMVVTGVYSGGDSGALATLSLYGSTKTPGGT